MDPDVFALVYLLVFWLSLIAVVLFFLREWR